LVSAKIHRKAALSKADRYWLAQLLAQIACDIDVRDRFFDKRHGRPADRDKQARAHDCALWIAVHSAPGRAGRLTVTQAKAAAEERWQMSTEQVRRAWLAHGASVRRFPAAAVQE